MKTLLSASLACLALTMTCPSQVPNWTEYKPGTKPVPRQNSAMVFDSARNVCVLFGAWDGSGRRNDTWEWDGAKWTEIKPATSPSPRDGMALAYDSARKVTVLTAGYVSPGEVWEYNGTTWTIKNPVTTHSLGAHSPMVYDADRKVCVLYGVKSGASQTWEWNGTSWTQKTLTSAPSGGASMAYDSLRKRTVLFNGAGQTWEYAGTNWVRVNTKTNPPGRGCAAGMVYDSARQVVVMFGGCGGARGDAWEYDGSDWRQIKTANVPSSPRRYVAMAYDSNRRRTVLFGGRDFSGTTSVIVGDTWEYERGPCYMIPDVSSIDITKGGTQTLALDAGKANSNRLFWIFGSMSGTSPGLVFNGSHIYLNPDPYTDLAIAFTNSAFMVNFRGVLDINGKSSAMFVIPPSLVTVPIKLHHAYAVYINFNHCTGNPVLLELK